MSAQSPLSSGCPEHDNTDASARKYFVHVYAVVRVKVAVDAQNHTHAMTIADEILFRTGFGVRFVPEAVGVFDASYAEEVVGYLINEADDPQYERTRNYGPDHEPQIPGGAHGS